MSCSVDNSRANLFSFSEDLIPTADCTYNLGSNLARVDDIFGCGLNIGVILLADGTLTNSGNASAVIGQVGTGAKIEAVGPGALAGGDCENSGGLISAIGSGSIAFGRTTASKIQSSGIGSRAGGEATGVGDILAIAEGSFAFGRAGNASITVTLSGKGAMAFGWSQYYKIEAAEKGAMAFGWASVASIAANQTNSFQFGPGTNNLPDSLKVGIGIQLKGTVGAPTSPINGQIWLGSDDFVYIRSSNTSIKLVACP